METFIFILIVLVASILQTSTGFGFSILATPFLLFLFEPLEAIQLNLLLSLVISSVLILKIRQDIDLGILKRFVIGSTAALPVGILIFALLDMRQLKLGIGLFLLAVTILLLFNFRIALTKSKDLVVGGISGALTASIGMPGPPILVYFSGADTLKEKVRATTLAFYLFIYSASLIIQVLFVGTAKSIWVAGGYGLPIVVVGLFLGQRLFNRINQTAFRFIMYAILLITGVYLLVENWPY